MPYTLAKAFVWLVLAGLLGMTVGWLLRSVTAHRQISRARSQHGDPAELERARARVTELEAAVADRDHLQADRDRLAAELASARAAASEARSIAREPDGDFDDALISAPPDLERAADEVGQPVERDDLKLIEGIGPSAEDLCHGIGIRTWADMAATEPSLLRTMLNDAGPRFKMLDPTAWPRQAALLAEHRWTEFRQLRDELRDGVNSK